jgi:hypothetical protein
VTEPWHCRNQQAREPDLSNRLAASTFAMLLSGMTLKDIQQAIAHLSLDDRVKLRHWLAEFEAEQAQQGEPEPTVSKLGRLAGRAVADFRKRMRDS